MERRPRTPGLILAIVALALALVVAVLALTSRQPPPPAIAEFAPQAVEKISEAPSDQSSDSGVGSGAGGESGALGEIAAPSASPIDVPRLRRCIGDPPRQIEDPQSPPCVPYWAGDNGGATSKGVTRDEIRIAVPFEHPTNSATASAQAQALEAFFNRRFEFYGRHMKLYKFVGKGANPEVVDPARQQADASTAADQLNAFASTAYAEQGGADYIYMDELARRGVISTASGWGLQVGERHFAERDPFEWGIQPGMDVIGRNLGEWACKQLAGRPASYAGTTERTKPRVFGLIVQAANEVGRPEVDGLRQALKACNSPIAREAEVSAGTGQRNREAEVAVLSMRDAGVTTILYAGHGTHMYTAAMPAASNQQYEPEWVLSSYMQQTGDDYGQLAPARQMVHAFGLHFLNPWLPTEDRPIRWAVREANPSLSEGDPLNNHYLYWPLLLLASGIQMAGPRLTPQTLRDGLRRATFPNPGSGALPWYQAHVGFGDDHVFFDDGAIVWWSPTALSPWNGRPGAFCLADGGRRHRSGTWPSEPATLYQGGCRP